MEIQISLLSLASTHKPEVGGSITQPFVVVFLKILSQLFRPQLFFLPVVLKPDDLTIVQDFDRQLVFQLDRSPVFFLRCDYRLFLLSHRLKILILNCDSLCFGSATTTHF